MTAASHRRALLVEVMGRNCGYLALMSGIAGGAEAIVLPEIEVVPEQLAERIQEAYERGKPHVIIVVAEDGDSAATAVDEVAKKGVKVIVVDPRFSATARSRGRARIGSVLATV